MIELKPCPFCGGKAEMITRWAGKPRNPEIEIPVGYYVQCGECFASTRIVDAKNARTPEGRKEFLQYAIEEWNRRTKK